MPKGMRGRIYSLRVHRPRRKTKSCYCLFACYWRQRMYSLCSVFATCIGGSRTSKRTFVRMSMIMLLSTTCWSLSNGTGMLTFFYGSEKSVLMIIWTTFIWCMILLQICYMNAKNIVLEDYVSMITFTFGFIHREQYVNGDSWWWPVDWRFNSG